MILLEKMPFRIPIAPEHFQTKMNRVLSGLHRVLYQMHVLVFGKNKKEDNHRLSAIVKRIETARVALNLSKCKFRKNKMKFLGHLIYNQGIQAEPDKTSAMREMQLPTNIAEL